MGSTSHCPPGSHEKDPHSLRGRKWGEDSERQQLSPMKISPLTPPYSTLSSSSGEWPRGPGIVEMVLRSLSTNFSCTDMTWGFSYPLHLGLQCMRARQSHFCVVDTPVSPSCYILAACKVGSSSSDGRCAFLEVIEQHGARALKLPYPLTEKFGLGDCPKHTQKFVYMMSVL